MARPRSSLRTPSYMVLNRQRRVRIALSPLEEFLSRVRKELKLDGRELSVCLVGETAMARMNRGFRGKRGPTDVLSFPCRGSERRRGRGNHEMASYLGDVAIAPGIARQNARRHARTLDNELRVLILHGVLHLLGYDHETDHGKMDRIERRLRRRLGLN